jgi:transposase InsO family protein
MSDKYVVIAAHRREFPVCLMCRVLDVSTSGFYAAEARPMCAQARMDEKLLVQVRASFTTHRKRYGSPRIHRHLRNTGTRVSSKRIARLMQQDGLVARPKRRFVRTTDSAHAQPLAPNTLARDFASAPARALNSTWVSDITYLPTGMGWLYLAVVLDLASRRVVGWATSASLDTALPLTALQRALATRHAPAGLLHHSDRGSQYASHAFRACLAAHRGIASMSRRGNCWDNAVAESFFATLEWELLTDERFASHTAMERALVTFIDSWYNRERMHSSLGYRSPADFEHDLPRTTRAA